jgi:hypothetical protein
MPSNWAGTQFINSTIDSVLESIYNLPLLLLLLLLLVGRYSVPRYLLVPGTVAILAYCTNPDDRWGWFLEQLVEWKLAGET